MAKKKALKLSNKYDGIIVKCANLYGVDKDLIKGLIAATSSFKPKFSKKKRKGLMWVSEGIASAVWGKQKASKWKKMFDPETNIETGTKYLKKYLKYYGNKRQALFDYFMGHREYGRQVAMGNKNLNQDSGEKPDPYQWVNDYFDKCSQEQKKSKDGHWELGECEQWITKGGVHICIKYKF